MLFPGILVAQYNFQIPNLKWVMDLLDFHG